MITIPYGAATAIIFKEIKKSQSRVIASFVKRARGMMTHYLIQNRIEAPERINRFKWWDINFRKMTSMMKIGRLSDLSRNPDFQDQKINGWEVSTLPSRFVYIRRGIYFSKVTTPAHLS